MTAHQSDVGVRPRLSARAVAAYALVALSPVLAWVAWVSWANGKPSDTMHVVWFLTVAAGCCVAGVLAAHTVTRSVALVAVAIVSTMTTLYLWWSSSDPTGLFAVGLMIASFPVILGAIAMVSLGRSVASEPPWSHWSK